MIDSSYNFNLNKLQFTSDSIGYVAGQIGEILKITNANTLFTSIQPILNSGNNFSIYPNPASTNIYVKTNKPELITVYDVFGRIQFEKIDTNDKIDISGLPAGIYILKTEERIAKFIKN